MDGKGGSVCRGAGVGSLFMYCLFCVLLYVVKEFIYVLLHDCAEDGDNDEREGFNLSFDLEMVTCLNCFLSYVI